MITYRAISSLEASTMNGDIFFGIHKSPFGWCVIAITNESICYLSFLESKNISEAIKEIKKLFPHGQIIRDDKKAKKYIEYIFFLTKAKKGLNLILKGTPFQIKVWNALLSIPKGSTSSYTEIAKAIGSPKAVRAVGTACGKNSIGFIIPCHRILTSSGKIGGYRWGIERKEAILAWEAVGKK